VYSRISLDNYWHSWKYRIISLSVTHLLIACVFLSEHRQHKPRVYNDLLSIPPNKVSNRLHNYARDILNKISVHTQRVLLNLFSCGAAPQRGPCLPIHEVSRPHIKTRVGTTPLDKWSACRRDLYLITQHPQQKNIHSLGRIRTRTPGEWPQPKP